MTTKLSESIRPAHMFEGKERFEFGVINLGSGIMVTINGVKGEQRIDIDTFDEIAAAVTAIKMYISSKNGKSKEKNLGNGRKNNGNNKDGKGILWFKSWLNELMRDFDLNSYRKRYLSESV